MNYEIAISMICVITQFIRNDYEKHDLFLSTLTNLACILQYPLDKLRLGYISKIDCVLNQNLAPRIGTNTSDISR